MFRIMWTGVPRCTKYESKLGHKVVYNSVMPYLMRLIITGLEFSKNPKNKQINPWPEYNPMALDKIMMNM